MTAAANLDPRTEALIADTRVLLQRTDALARQLREEREAAPARLHQAHQLGQHRPASPPSPRPVRLAGPSAWPGSTSSATTCAPSPAAWPATWRSSSAAWPPIPRRRGSWLDTHRDLRERLVAEEDHGRPAR
jgi:hypothetical protein